ncbi:MAG: glycerophosphodiester phosphodiesterase family protein [Elusimicrobia bacterium]|nr:glycerophosphodiester phosphodiesterase family protein [Elusimicrobiota bacterium]
MQSLRLLSSALFALIVTAAPPVGAAASGRTVQVYAHRGARSFAPENTMPAYKTTLRLGADWVDMDVVLTKDGEVLVSHDPILNADITRGPDGKFLAKSREALKSGPPEALADYERKYTAKNLTLAELRKFDVGRLNPDSEYAKFFPDQLPVDGTPMPTLREVVRFVNAKTHGKVGFQIEMKTNPARPEVSADPAVFAAALVKVLREEGVIDRAEIQAFDFRCLFELQKLDKRAKTAYLTSRENEKDGPESFYAEDAKVAGLSTGGKLVKEYGGSIPGMVKALGGYAWEPEDAELTKESLDEAHRLGLKVVVWSWPEKLGTTFDAKLVARLIEWGVDGIITDDPGRLTSMLAARGLRVPGRYKID